MARGDHIKVFRRGYWHHGIDCGDGTVIHYTGELFNRKGAAIKRTTMEEFAKGGRVRVVRTKSPYDTEGKLLRAQSRMNEAQYSPVSNNCEHFARWCTTGTSESRQVRRTITALAGVTVAAVTVMAALQMVKAVVKPAARA